MERRELYDPEDIEQLLFERPYDTLLEEERAFVLRHLSGRAEYEAMRALLLRVHEDEGAAQVPAADPQVRDRVLDAFRAEQRPQWRIWLNSLGTLLWPREVSAMWRPALALAGLAAVATAALFVVRSTSSDMERPAIAEVHQEKTVAPAKDLDAPAIASTRADSAPASQMDRASAPAGNASSMEATTLSADVAVEPAPKEPVTEEELTGSEAERKESVAFVPPAPATTRAVVTDYDLARNQSTADASEQLAAAKVLSKQADARKFKKDEAGKAEDDAAGTDVTALVGLLRAAW